MTDKLKAWIDRPAKISDVLLIAVMIAYVFCMFSGDGAERNAKQYADSLVRGLR